jgi:signal transduction histidine kinase
VEVAELLRQVASVHQARRLRIEVDAVAGCHVLADRTLLSEAVSNLLVNADEAGAKSARLTATREGTEVAIACQDDGPGIASDFLARVGRLNFTTKPNGSGFGLYFAGQLAAQLGGRLEVHSEPNAGALLRLVLPNAYHPHR